MDGFEAALRDRSRVLSESHTDRYFINIDLRVDCCQIVRRLFRVQIELLHQSVRQITLPRLVLHMGYHSWPPSMSPSLCPSLSSWCNPLLVVVVVHNHFMHADRGLWLGFVDYYWLRGVLELLSGLEELLSIELVGLTRPWFQLRSVLHQSLLLQGFNRLKASFWGSLNEGSLSSQRDTPSHDTWRLTLMKEAAIGLRLRSCSRVIHHYTSKLIHWRSEISWLRVHGSARMRRLHWLLRRACYYIESW